jgi:hypothetical protein
MTPWLLATQAMTPHPARCAKTPAHEAVDNTVAAPGACRGSTSAAIDCSAGKALIREF